MRTAHELNASSRVCLEQRWVPKETRRDCLGSPIEPPTSGPHTEILTELIQAEAWASLRFSRASSWF